MNSIALITNVTAAHSHLKTKVASVSGDRRRYGCETPHHNDLF